MKRLFLFLSFICVSFVSFAQESDSPLLLYGKIVEGSTPLYNVHIVNQSLNTGTVTNFDGDFTLKAHPLDTVTFTSIGYKPVQYIVSDSVEGEGYRILVNMVSDTIFLKEAVVMPWPANLTMLKQAMLEQEKEEELVGVFAGFRKNDAPVKEPAPKVYNPISFLYNMFSKKSRQLKKIAKWQQEMDAYEKQGKNVEEKEIKY